MSTRSLLMVSLVLSGCATAGEPSHENATDAAINILADAPRSSDATNVVPGDAPAGGCAFTGVLATWDLTGQPGSQTDSPATATANGVTAGNIHRSSALTAVSGADSINASGWTTATHLDSTKYCTLTITPPSGCSIDLTALSVDVKASASGPATAVVATSSDTYAQTAAVSTSSASNATLSVTNASGAIELRIYGYGATGATGTMRVQNTLTVSGSIH
jgi:hypothetical protein